MGWHSGLETLGAPNMKSASSLLEASLSAHEKERGQGRKAVRDTIWTTDTASLVKVKERITENSNIWALHGLWTCRHLELEGGSEKELFPLSAGTLSLLKSEGRAKERKSIGIYWAIFWVQGSSQQWLSRNRRWERSAGVWSMLKAESRAEKWDRYSRQIAFTIVYVTYLGINVYKTRKHCWKN